VLDRRYTHESAGPGQRLDRVLAAYADSARWTRVTPSQRITTVALSFIGAGMILHVGIGLRWPFARTTTQQNP